MELIIVSIHPLVKLKINVSILWLDNTIQLINKSAIFAVRSYTINIAYLQIFSTC